MALLADVIVDRVVESLDRPFSYGVPEAFERRLTVGQLVRVPFGGGRVQGVVRRLYTGEREARTKDIEAIMQDRPVVTPVLLELAEWLSDRYLCYLSQALRAMIPTSVRNDVTARPKHLWYRAVGVRQGRASVKQTVFDYVKAHHAVDRRTILDAFPSAQAALRALVAEGALEVLTRAPDHLFEPTPAHTLTDEQDAAFRTMLDHPGQPWLLEGVTGSGKTEVYLALIEEAQARGRQAMVLLPEIALTPQVVTRFRDRFGGRVAVWHSGLSAGERRTTWEAVRDGEATVVVGARSAVFLPFPALGVIVLDEEHEPTYKQEEHPRYHTREVALWRGRREQATVVLGSATPAVETRFAAEAGLIGHVRIAGRALGRSLPSVTLVDMRDELRAGNREIFSRPLRESLATVLGRGEQAILFLNRRGYSTFVLCRSCGQALECPDCAVSLTYHQRENRLVCHYCLQEHPLPTRCPECGSDKIRYFGAGTERIVEEVERLHPGTRILRADRDTLTRPDDYGALYQAFLQGDADVLVGTQMIAKGMDFPRVTLVGVVAADTALHLPDYRSAERTFQLLVQAGGRSGRGDMPGRVVVQTYNPDHYAVQHAFHHDYDAFYRDEVRFREETHYPPYAELWLMGAEGPDEGSVKERTLAAALDLRNMWPDAEVLGPAPAPLARVRGQYRYHLLVKQRGAENGHAAGQDLRAFQGRHPGLNITRDPYFLM